MKGLLVDTHALLWWRGDEGRLSRRALDSMEDPTVPLFFSAASVWEMEIKRAKGKLDAPGDLLETTLRQGFSELPMTSIHAAAAARLPMHHQDPFDRMIVAQSQCEDLTIVTHDERIASYQVPVLW